MSPKPRFGDGIDAKVSPKSPFGKRPLFRSAASCAACLLGLSLAGAWTQTEDAGLATRNVPTLHLLEARDAGKIRLEARGAGLLAVELRVTSLAGEPMTVVVPVGTYFVNQRSGQDMIATVRVALDIAPRQERWHRIPASGANAFQDVPGSSSRFTISVLPPSADLRRLMNLLAREPASPAARQVAVWILMDDISRDALNNRYSRLAATDEDVLHAMRMVEAAGIDPARRQIFRERLSAIRGLGSVDPVRRRYASRLLAIDPQDRVDFLLGQLANGDQRIRPDVARVLGDIGAPRAVGPLIAATRDGNVFVRASAALALGRMADERAVEHLLAALEDDYSIVRNAAGEALEAMGEAVTLERLTAALQYDGPHVRAGVARVLGHRRDPRVVEPLLAALSDENAEVRAAAALALGEIRDPRAIEPLLATLRDEDRAVMEAANGSLERMLDALDVERLLAALADLNPGVRQHAAGLLALKEDARAVEPLILVLNDRNFRVRAGAARALGQLQDERAIDPLLVALEDDGALVRANAAEALGRLGASSDVAVEALVALLEDEARIVQNRAMPALREITGERLGDDVEAWLAWWEERVEEESER